MTKAAPGGQWAAVGTSAGAPGSSEPTTFAAIWTRYFDMVRRTLACLGVPATTLDDAVQEVFLVVHRRLATTAGAVAEDAAASQKQWIYGIARRVAWRHHRTLTRERRRLELVEPPSSVRLPDSLVERSEAIAFMTDFLEALEPEQREVFVLAEIESFTAREIAEVMASSPNTVASRLRLARAKFEAALQRHRAKLSREERR